MPRKKKTFHVAKDGSITPIDRVPQRDHRVFPNPAVVEPAPPARPGMKTVTLTTMHSINGSRFGPGTMTLPDVIADTLIENERNIKAAETKFWTPGAGIIVPGGGLIPVSPQVLNSTAHLPATLETGRI